MGENGSFFPYNLMSTVTFFHGGNIFTAYLLNIQDRNAGTPPTNGLAGGSKRQEYIKTVFNRVTFRHHDHKLTVPTGETGRVRPAETQTAANAVTRPRATVRLATPDL